MSTVIETFFAAWGETDADKRSDMLASCLAPKCVYADPRTPAPINDNSALADYVGMFSANAPGWTAKVVKSDTIADLTRATVAFGGKGPDGSEMVQHGQYFISMDEDGSINNVTGFVGTGAPE